MIASVARESGRTVQQVGADSYALTLWAFLHSKDAQRLESLVRQAEAIDAAEMIAFAFHDPKKLNQFRQRLRSEFVLPVTEKTIEELSREADDLWRQHELAKRPVS